jgi:death-on-curing family protein
VIIQKLTTADVKEIAYRLAKKFMEWDEPIPDFLTRYKGVLESCVNEPFQTYNRKDLHSTFEDKAAILFYLMIKNHPFENGNKRIAVCALFVFLALNGKWIDIMNEELYRFSVWVAESMPEMKDGTTLAIKDFIGKNMINLPKK